MIKCNKGEFLTEVIFFWLLTFILNMKKKFLPFKEKICRKFKCQSKANMLQSYFYLNLICLLSNWDIKYKIKIIC